MTEHIANAALKEAEVPPADARWGEIGAFALTFNGYEHWGSFEKCAEVGNRWAKAYAQREALPKSLAELRTCLFFEQRRWRHFGRSPDTDAMMYIRALVEAIRRKVQA